MADIKDFHCTYDNLSGIPEEVVRQGTFSFPEAYLHTDMMAELAWALKTHEKTAFCELPFCHTVEAEAMGGNVNYGDSKAGPRGKDYICTDVEELLALPEIDFSKGRIHEVLTACRKLREQGEHVVLQVSGPLTVLNVLIDPRQVYKAMRKTPDLMKQIFWKVGEELVRFMETAKEYDVELFSYADSSGGVNILGPKMAEQVVNDFTYRFLKKVETVIDEHMMIHLCPKTVFALLGTQKAEFSNVKLSRAMRYDEACVEMIGKVKFAGQMCIKNVNYRLEDGMFKSVVLK